MHTTWHTDPIIFKRKLVKEVMGVGSGWTRCAILGGGVGGAILGSGRKWREVEGSETWYRSSALTWTTWLSVHVKMAAAQVDFRTDGAMSGGEIATCRRW